MQEVTQNARRTRHHDQPLILAERLCAGAHLYQMNVCYREGGYGNLLLSRWPLRRRHQVSLRLGRRNLDEIEATVARHGIDCDFSRAGELHVATADWQWRELVASHACAKPARELFAQYRAELPPFLDPEWLEPVRIAPTG